MLNNSAVVPAASGLVPSARPRTVDRVQVDELSVCLLRGCPQGTAARCATAGTPARQPVCCFPSVAEVLSDLSGGKCLKGRWLG